MRGDDDVDDDADIVYNNAFYLSLLATFCSGNDNKLSSINIC